MEELTLRHLEVWQDVSGCCITAGRPRRGQWSIKAFGNCVIHGGWFEAIGRADRFEDAVLDLLEKMRSILTDERIRRAM